MEDDHRRIPSHSAKIAWDISCEQPLNEWRLRLDGSSFDGQAGIDDQIFRLVSVHLLQSRVLVPFLGAEWAVGQT